MAWIDAITMIVVAALSPFVNLSLFSAVILLIGFAVGGRAGVTAQANVKIRIGVAVGTVLLWLCCSYAAMFYSLNKYGS